MQTDGRKKVKGKIIQLPEGNVTVLNESEPMMVMVRQSQLVERMDPGFWAPHLVRIIAKLRSTKFGVTKLQKYEPYITYGPIITGRTPPLHKQGVFLIGIQDVTRTGLDLTNAQRIAPNCEWDIPRARLNPGDIVIVRSGIGSIGRCCVVLSDIGAVVGCFVDLVRLPVCPLKPEFVCLFLLSTYGSVQLERAMSGVTGTANIAFHHIRSLEIPLVPLELQSIFAAGYSLMALFHEQAMEAKAENESMRAEHYLQIAEGMLEALIAQVEWLIEGKREKVTPLIPENAQKALQEDFVQQYCRIGERWRELERQREGRRILGIPTERYPEIADAVRRLLEQVEEVMAGKRKNVDPVL